MLSAFTTNTAKLSLLAVVVSLAVLIVIIPMLVQKKWRSTKVQDTKEQEEERIISELSEVIKQLGRLNTELNLRLYKGTNKSTSESPIKVNVKQKSIEEATDEISNLLEVLKVDDSKTNQRGETLSKGIIPWVQSVGNIRVETPAQKQLVKDLIAAVETTMHDIIKKLTLMSEQRRASLKQQYFGLEHSKKLK